MTRAEVLAAGLICASVLFGAAAPERGVSSKVMAQIPLSFERNAGQWADKSAGWIGNANGYRVALSATGAFRSTNGGVSFTQVSTLASGVTYGYPSAVAGSPDGSIYVANCSLAKSTDFGTTWTTQWLDQCIGDIAVSPSNPAVVGSAWNNTMELFRSSDAGATWTKVTSPGAGGPMGTMMVVAQSNPNVVYVGWSNQMAVSTDGGTTWSNAATLPNTIWTIGVSSSDPAAVYVGTNSTSDGFAANSAPTAGRCSGQPFIAAPAELP